MTRVSNPPARLEKRRLAVALREQGIVVYTIDVHSLPGQPFGRETFALREDAESFVEHVRQDDPELASDLRIDERELVAA